MAFVGWCTYSQINLPSVAAYSLKILDFDVRSCFSKCFSVDLSKAAWGQSQLSLRFGGFGLRSLSNHSSAALMASLCSSGFATADYHHLIHAVNTFNSIMGEANYCGTMKCDFASRRKS